MTSPRTQWLALANPRLVTEVPVGVTPEQAHSTSARAAPAGDVGQRLLDALGLKSTDKLGGEVTFRMGAVLALTGNGSYYGKTMTNGIELAAKHIKAAGGPTFEVAYKDHKSGDP